MLTEAHDIDMICGINIMVNININININNVNMGEMDEIQMGAPQAVVKLLLGRFLLRRGADKAFLRRLLGGALPARSCGTFCNGHTCTYCGYTACHRATYVNM
jgi:hypothetical protein